MSLKTLREAIINGTAAEVAEHKAELFQTEYENSSVWYWVSLSTKETRNKLETLMSRWPAGAYKKCGSVTTTDFAVKHDNEVVQEVLYGMGADVCS
jgi:hypothetical protein